MSITPPVTVAIFFYWQLQVRWVPYFISITCTRILNINELSLAISNVYPNHTNFWGAGFVSWLMLISLCKHTREVSQIRPGWQAVTCALCLSYSTRSIWANLYQSLSSALLLNRIISLTTEKQLSLLNSRLLCAIWCHCYIRGSTKQINVRSETKPRARYGFIKRQ